MLNRYFSRIYVINLASRTDRREEMALELARIGLSFEDEAVTLFPAVKPEEAGGFPSIGAHGCFMSHLNILRDAAERGEGPIAILEDDLEIPSDFAERAPAILEALQQKDWSVFYGGYEGAAFDGGAFVDVPPTTGLKTTHFICVNKSTITKIVEYFEVMRRRPGGDPKGGPMHVDGAYSWFRKDHPELAVYAANPPIGDQRSSRSDIADLRWHDRTPVVRNLASIARRLRRALK